MKTIFFIILIGLSIFNKTLEDHNTDINNWGGDPSLISWWN